MILNDSFNFINETLLKMKKLNLKFHDFLFPVIFKTFFLTDLVGTHPLNDRRNFENDSAKV